MIAQSTFDSGDEGWRVGEFFSADGAAVPTHVPSGGNPGGFVRTGDLFAWSAYHAPVKFLGNRSAAYGGTLHLELQTPASDAVSYPMIVLSNGALSLQFRTMPPDTTWTSYDIPLVAAAGWEVADGSGVPGPPATETQLQQILANLTFLHVAADWLSGPTDQVDLDNVRLESSDPAVVTVAIDIKPGAPKNRIDPRERGRIQVAILTTDLFDATTVDPSTVRFGRAGTEASPVHVTVGDLDDDGDLDMLLHFKMPHTGIRCGDTVASLTGATAGGQDIEGSDLIQTVGCK